MRITTTEQREDKEEDETEYVEGIGYVWKGKKYDKNKGFVPLTAEEVDYLNSEEGKRNTRTVESKESDFIKEREARM